MSHKLPEKDFAGSLGCLCLRLDCQPEAALGGGGCPPRASLKTLYKLPSEFSPSAFSSIIKDTDAAFCVGQHHSVKATFKGQVNKVSFWLSAKS